MSEREVGYKAPNTNQPHLEDSTTNNTQPLPHLSALGRYLDCSSIYISDKSSQVIPNSEANNRRPVSPLSFRRRTSLILSARLNSTHLNDIRHTTMSNAPGGAPSTGTPGPSAQATHMASSTARTHPMVRFASTGSMASSSVTGDDFTPEMRDRQARGKDPYHSGDGSDDGNLSDHETGLRLGKGRYVVPLSASQP